MTPRLLVAIAVVTLMGAVLDATLWRDATGAELPTVGVREALRAEARGVDLEQVVPTLIGEAQDMGVVDGRFALYLAMREEAPGARVRLDVAVDEADVVPLYLRTFGAVRSVGRLDASAVLPPAGSPTRSGTFRSGPWALHLGPGKASDLIILTRGGTFNVVDERLLAGLPESSAPSFEGSLGGSLPIVAARHPDDPPSLLGAVAGESAFMLLILLLGGLLIPRGSIRPSIRAGLAVIVGLALQGAIGLLLLPGIWGPVATVLSAVVIALGLRGRGTPVGWGRDDVGPVALMAASIVGVVVVARWNAFLLLAADSFHYWAGGASFADGTFGLGDLEIKRGVVLQSLHGVGFLLGIEGLQSLGPVVAAMSAVIIFGVLRREGGRVAPLSVVLALAVSPQIRAMTAFLGSHVLVAGLLLALVVLLGQGGDMRRERELLPAVVVLIVALTTLRAEGILLVGLVLVGMLAARDERPVWRTAWIGLGGSALVWTALLAAASIGSGNGVPIAHRHLALLALATLSVGWSLPRIPPRMRRAVPLVTGGSLWVIALLAMRAEPIRFLDMVVENIGRGAGGWGSFGPLLFIVAAIAIALTRGSSEPMTLAARWLLIGFIPVALFVKLGDGLEVADAALDLLLSGGGRVGWGDSVNRMWTHTVLLIPLLLGHVYEAQDRRSPDAVTGTVRARASVASSGAILVAFTSFVTMSWAPQYAPGWTTTIEQPIRSVVGEQPILELVDGAEVDQRIVLPPVVLPSELRVTGICLDLPFITFDRRTVGDVEVVIRSGELVNTRRLDGRDIGDWVPERICVHPGEAGPASVMGLLEPPLEVTVRGVGGQVGSSVGLLEGAGTGPGATFSLPSTSGPVTGRADHLVGDIVIIAERPLALFERPLERTTRFLPSIASLLGLIAFAHHAAGSRARSGPSEESSAEANAGR